jgi:hypothetical protein
LQFVDVKMLPFLTEHIINTEYALRKLARSSHAPTPWQPMQMASWW